MNGAQQVSVQAVITHAHARDLASCWQDAANDDHPVTRLARTGEITPDAGRAIAHDLNLLESASATWDYPASIPEKQLRVLLGYVRHHGPRPAVDGWHRHRDAEFLRSIRRMAAEARSHAPPDDEPPAPVRQMPAPRRRS
ncbi:MAG TPA: hypothetical protein VFZ70_06270 [Euzebyales bacterium]